MLRKTTQRLTCPSLTIRSLSSPLSPSRPLSSFSWENDHALHEASSNEQQTTNKHPIPNFNDSRAAYETKSTKDLIRASACFRLCQIPLLVNNAEMLIGTSRRVLGNRITDSVLKTTMFGHFCAGEDQTRIRPAVRKLDEAGIGSILDYAAESDGQPSALVSLLKKTEDNPHVLRQAREYDYESEAQCDKHVAVFKKCIGDVAGLGSKDGYAAVKVTALGNPRLLARMSQAIVEAKKLFEKLDANKDGTLNREEFEMGYNVFFKDADVSVKDIFEQFDPEGVGSVDYITWSKMLRPTDLPKITARCKEAGPLALATPTDEELELIEAMYVRGHVLGEEAAKSGTRLLIDAEQVRYQPAIDSLVLDLQQKFNATEVTDKPIIYNTYQCYLKDSEERLHTDVLRSDRFDYHFGAKLVRGAYMESERSLAATSSLPSPIYDTIEETHECYNESIDFLLRHSSRSDKCIEVMCATHNQASLETAIEAMNKYQIDRTASTICFAQLYGMSDNLTFNLGKHGYRAYKYVPYGEVHEVMPYLLRRARENSAIMGVASYELTMIHDELRRRFTNQSQLVTA